MVLTVELHTVLREQVHPEAGGPLQVDLPAGSTLADLLRHFSIILPVDALILVVNGRVAGVDTPLHPGDRVDLIPAISGGKN